MSVRISIMIQVMARVLAILTWASLLTVVGLIAAAVVFPPWVAYAQDYEGSVSSSMPMGRHPLWSPPSLPPRFREGNTEVLNYDGRTVSWAASSVSPDWINFVGEAYLIVVAGLAFSATLLVAQLWAAASARRDRRLRGLCTECGYDLRSTPIRCPECGHGAETRFRS